MGWYYSEIRTLLALVGEWAALDRVIDGFLGNAENAHSAVAHIAEVFHARWTGVVGIDHHVPGPSPEVYSGSGFRCSIPLVSEYIQQFGLLYGAGVEEICAVALPHVVI